MEALKQPHKNSNMKILILTLLAIALAVPAFAKPLDVNYGTLEVPDDFVFTKTGTMDSFRGTLVRKSDNFTITFDIGKMAGTAMTESKKATCTYFRRHRIGAFSATTGIETISGKSQITTTFDYDSKTERAPANFWATISKDTDIADFLLIIGSYQPKTK